MPILALLALAFASHTSADKWCFVVAGDGRADGKAIRKEDRNGVNVQITKEIAQAVLDEKAKFLMWTGDLVLGYSRDEKDFEQQLMTWRETMSPLYDKNIPVLPCRGNHEAGSPHSAAIWNQVFTGSYALPTNGPKTEKGLTFYYRLGPVLAIGLDQYQSSKESIDQAWLDDVLARNRAPFVFAMGHEPAFMDGTHKDTMDADPKKRDTFWQSLIRAGARVFFAGHDHLYDHMSVVREGPDPGPEMHQFVAGTAGAPFYKEGPYTGKNEGWKLTRLKHIDKTYGYLLVEIEGSKATISFKGRTSPGHYEVMDSYSYSATD